MKHCVLTSLQDGLSVSPSIYNYAKPPKTTQNGQKTRWLQTDPQRTHLFACPGLFILTFSMMKQNWYDYFKILQQLGRIWIKKSLVFIINGAWACSYKCFGGGDFSRDDLLEIKGTVVLAISPTLSQWLVHGFPTVGLIRLTSL